MTDRHERELRDKLNDYGWLVHRHAGSHGVAGDLSVTLPSGKDRIPSNALLIEQKTSKENDLNLKDGQGNYEQFQNLKQLSDEGWWIWYAVRHTSGSRENRWRFHDLNDVDLTDYPHILRRQGGLTIDELFDRVDSFI